MSMMDDRQWPQFADQFDEHAMPCHGCGTLVRVASSSVEDICQAWAEDVARVWCAECWPHGNEANTAEPQPSRAQRRGTKTRDRIMRLRRGGKR